MRGSRSRGRDRTGQFKSSFEENEIVGLGRFATPKARKVLPTEGRESWPGFLSMDSQTNDQKDMDKSIRRVYSHALLCSRITSTLLFITKCLVLVIALLFIKSTIQGHNTVLLKILWSCFEGNEYSCYSKVGDTFFHSNETAMQRWVTCRLADTNIAGSRNIFEISFPLIIDNPVIIPMAAIAVAIAYWLLSYLHGFIIDVAATANRADPQLRGKHS